ncbi:hypothetical protein Q5P01_009230 [Channa striata]|uniref:Uncharacterized protein n=1 Tax=Channa striata TaxID=64152 RepID=A0AA88N0U7_CHASR|nr:hypothetical protein Q5P01_009230 [Channa striata]
MLPNCCCKHFCHVIKAERCVRQKRGFDVRQTARVTFFVQDELGGVLWRKTKRLLCLGSQGREEHQQSEETEERERRLLSPLLL